MSICYATINNHTYVIAPTPFAIDGMPVCRIEKGNWNDEDQVWEWIFTTCQSVGKVTVHAHTNLGIAEEDLPDCWSLTCSGPNCTKIDGLTCEVDLAIGGKATIDAQASDIHYRVIITVVAIDEISLDKTAIVANAIDSTGEAEATSGITPNDRTLVWSLLCDENNNVISSVPNDNNKILIKAGSGGGKIIVRASDKDFPSCYQEIYLDVVKVDSIGFDASALKIGDSVQAVANVQPGDYAIQWSIEGKTLCAEIDEDTGLITGGARPGSITVRATAIDFPDMYAEATLNVCDFNMQDAPIKISSAEIDGTSPFCYGEDINATVNLTGKCCAGEAYEGETALDITLPNTAGEHKNEIACVDVCGVNLCKKVDDYTVVEMGEVSFCPARLVADGESQTQASVEICPDTYDSIDWKLVHPTTGELVTSTDYAEIDSSGLITAGKKVGVIEVRATANFDSDCYSQKKLVIDKSRIGQCVKNPTKSAEGETTTANSVGLRTGLFSFDKSLVSMGAPGAGGWSFDISYRSSYGIKGLLGKNFNYTQHDTLTRYTSGDVVLETSDNSSELFVYNPADGTYGGVNNSAARLTSYGSGANETYRILTSDGGYADFYGFNDSIAAPGKIKSLVDRNGNGQTFEWTNTGGQDQLVSIVDTYGREIMYSYYGSEKNYRLKEIEDYIGRKLNFQYDDYDRLVAIITPSVTKGADDDTNVFTNGTAYVFQYDANNARADRRDDLIRIWFPNETTDFITTQIDPQTQEEIRVIDVDSVYSQATPRYTIEYGQNPAELNHYGKVIRETIGTPLPRSGAGGTEEFEYVTDPQSLPENLVHSASPIVSRTIHTDKNGNIKIYDFDTNGNLVRQEVQANRSKNSLHASGYVTWTKYNSHGQEELVIYPEGNCVEYEYEDEFNTITLDGVPYAKRIGLLRRETQRIDNDYGIAYRQNPDGYDQTRKTTLYFYDPIFNQQCASIEYCGNPINEEGDYFAPQNGGTAPSDSDRSRYATFHYLDYQQNTISTVINDSTLQSQTGLTASQMQSLIDYVDQDMIDNGLPSGFQFSLGDLNGDGRGSNTGHNAYHNGDVVKIKRPSVRLLDGTSQLQVELITNNLRGQQTTVTDASGTTTAYVRYPDNDPEGDGLNITSGSATKQYGYVKETHLDISPTQVMNLIGENGDLLSFSSTIYPRTLHAGIEYQDIITQHQSSVGGCSACGYDQMGNERSETDPRGFTTFYDRNEIGQIYRITGPLPYEYKKEIHYDANGNVIREDIEDVVVEFDSDDTTSADYAKITPIIGATAGVAHLPTEAGDGGSIRSGWFVRQYEYDLVDKKVSESIEATGSTPATLVTEYEYDGNGNLTKIIKPLENIVEYDYDERDLQIAQRVGYDPGSAQAGIVTVSAYDRNGNLVYQITAGDLDGSGDNNSTVTIGDAFRSAQALVHTGELATENVYDGFDRLIKIIDAAGGVVQNQYDPADRNISTVQEGQISGPTPDDRTQAGNVTLAATSSKYDEQGRIYEVKREVFLADGVTLSSSRSVTHTGGGLEENSIANGHTTTADLTQGESSYILMHNEYDLVGRLVRRIADNTGQTDYEYDMAGRVLKTTDPDGNTVENTYDKADNVIAVKRTEVCTIVRLGNEIEEEVFESASFYDAMGRVVIRATQGPDGVFDTDITAQNNQTLFTMIGYDSRNNQTLTIDPKENTTLTIYDGANRSIETHQHMRVDGNGANGPATGHNFSATGQDCVRTQRVYDANSRLVQLIDATGATTVCTYDLCDRKTTVTFPDSTQRTTEYDSGTGMVSSYTDENGTEFEYTYDALGRRIQINITLATGVLGTTQQTFQYDGIGRTTQAEDSCVQHTSVCTYVYDSLGRLIEETQTLGGVTRYVTNSAFESSYTTSQTYPDGREIVHEYDLLGRRRVTQDAKNGSGGFIAEWEYFGPARLAEMTLGNGLCATWMNNDRSHATVQSGVSNPAWGDASSDRLGYDGVGRMITKRYVGSALSGDSYYDPMCLTGHTTQYDDSSNKLYERHLHAENRSFLYNGLDSLNRLCENERGTLASGGESISSAITLSGTDSMQSWDLNEVGNWLEFETQAAGTQSSETQTRTHNSLHQITAIDNTPLSYDDNGNLLDDGHRMLVYDAFNRLKTVTRKSDDQLLASYIYDAMGRRIQKMLHVYWFSGFVFPTPEQRDYYYVGNQCVEERNDFPGLSTITKQYVWGLYVDEPIQMRLNVSGAFQGDVYPLQDMLYRTTAVTDSNGDILEIYDTDAYGRTMTFSPAGGDADWFTDDDNFKSFPSFEYIFTGRRYDPESELYFYRARYYNPALGRFLQRDPILYKESMNIYEYVRSNSINRLDPTGLDSNAANEARGALGKIHSRHAGYIYYETNDGWLTGLRHLIWGKLNKALWWLGDNDYSYGSSDSAIAAYYPLMNDMVIQHNPDPYEVLHEAIHAYNDMVNRYENERMDEGIAYAVSAGGTDGMAVQLERLQKVEKAFSAPRINVEELKKEWGMSWAFIDIIGRVTGRADGKDFMVNAYDVDRVDTHLGFKIRCHEIAEVYNKIPNVKNQCIQFFCNTYHKPVRLGKWIGINTFKELHYLFA